jgi:hypothetical protein
MLEVYVDDSASDARRACFLPQKAPNTWRIDGERHDLQFNAVVNSYSPRNISEY